MAFKPLIPKEHGSWAMLIVPLLLGTLIAPAWQGRVLLLWVAAFGFFSLRYPLALLVKTRKRPTADRAYLWRWAAIYAGLTALSGGWLVWVDGLWGLVVMALGGGLLLGLHLWLVARRQEMSLSGELAGVAGLALGAPMAYYTASGQLDGTATALWLVNTLYFSGTVFYIKLKVRQQPRWPAPARPVERLIQAKACLGYQFFALTLVMGLALSGWIPLLTPLAFIPATLKMGVGAWRWQDKKSLSLMRLGVIELIHSVIFALLTLVAFGL